MNEKKEDNFFKLDIQLSSKISDQQLIEAGFSDFETGNIFSEEKMTSIFGAYGWGE